MVDGQIVQLDEGEICITQKKVLPLQPDLKKTTS